MKIAEKGRMLQGRVCCMRELGRSRGAEQSGRTFVILNTGILSFFKHILWDSMETLFSLVSCKSHIKKKNTYLDFTIRHLFLKEQNLAC